jgi:hypothetical protein
MNPRCLYGPAALILALSLSPAVIPAQAATGAFAALAGNWSGGGTLQMANGGSEPLRCRASYSVGSDGGKLRLSIRCASDSYRIDLASNVASNGTAISGQWSEASQNASGTLSGQANGNRITALARGDTFSANLSLTTQGNRQTIAIRPRGTQVQSVSLTLSRR